MWTDPQDGKNWQGRFTDVDGNYKIGEDARSYEVYAIFKTQHLRALFLLDADLDHPDGSRDFFFRKIAEGVLVNVEFQPYTGGFGKEYNTDGTFRNLPPEWDFG